MNVDRFVTERRDSWDQLRALVEAAKGRPDRLTPRNALRLGELYRATAADLALARRRFPSEAIVPSLDALVKRARALVYGAPARRGTLGGFFAREYWVRVLERPWLTAAAAALLFVPGIVAGIWGWLAPAQASSFVPGVLSGGREAGSDLGLSLGQQAEFSSTIFTNNIRVSLLAFALGITCGIGTAIVLVMNGVLLGVVFGIATAGGNGAVVLEYVVAHGVLELSCIVVTAAAGLRIGWAIVDPGYRPRLEVLQSEGRAAVETLLGTAPWLVVAGFIEGFITPSGFGLAAVIFVGLLFGGMFWALAFGRGRQRTAIALQPRARLGTEVRSDTRRAERVG